LKLAVQPVETAGGIAGTAQTILIIVGALAAAGFGSKYGTAQAFASGFAVLFVLFFVAALRLQAELDELATAPRPCLRFGQPFVDDDHGVVTSQNEFVGHASFVILPLLNDPPPGKKGETAKSVHAVFSIHDLDGETLTPERGARWQATPQAPDRSAISPVNTAEMTEANIPPNRRPHNIDTVMTFFGGGNAYLWTNDSMKTADPMFGKRLHDRFRIEPEFFTVRVRVDGENIDPVSTEFIIWRRFPGLSIVTREYVEKIQQLEQDLKQQAVEPNQTGS
jgi:hypothetical protein